MNHDIEKALDNLEKRAQDIQHYMNIMSKVKTVNVADDQDFQREFDFFYKVRRNAEWRKVFFEIFERKKKKNCSYKEIITEPPVQLVVCYKPSKGLCYYSPQRAVSQAFLLVRYKAVLLESSFLDSSACSFIYFCTASSVILPIVST